MISFIRSLLIVLQIDEDNITQCENRIGAPISLEAKADPALVAAVNPPGGSTSEPTATSPPTPASVAMPTVTAPMTSGPQRSATGEKPPPVYPIEGLSPYQNKWSIKARVTQKSEIKEWSNPRGRGKVFNITLMDETGEIRATGFNKAVDVLYDRIEEGKVYFLSRARVNVAKKKFSNLNSEYEIMLDERSEFHEVRLLGSLTRTIVLTIKHFSVRMLRMCLMSSSALSSYHRWRLCKKIRSVVRMHRVACS
jgi:replication factor A1